MEIRLHHVNVSSDIPEEMAQFYHRVLGLRDAVELERHRIGNIVRSTTDKFADDGRIQFHLSVRDSDLGFRSGHVVNPVAGGHLAFRASNIEEVKRRLQDHDIPFSDYGVWAMDGWYQIFFHDPAGTVIEVFQADDQSANPPKG